MMKATTPNFAPTLPLLNCESSSPPEESLELRRDKLIEREAMFQKKINEFEEEAMRHLEQKRKNGIHFQLKSYDHIYQLKFHSLFVGTQKEEGLYISPPKVTRSTNKN